MIRGKQKGITLIALIITIIVILILAGVSIMTLSGDNGLLKKAEGTNEKSIIAMEKDEISLAYLSCTIDNFNEHEVRADQLEKELKENGNNVTAKDETNHIKVKFNDTEHTYLVDENGNITMEKDTATQQYEEEKARIDEGLKSQEETIASSGYVDSLKTLDNPDRGLYKVAYASISDSGFTSNINDVCSTAIRSSQNLIHLRVNIGNLSGNVNSEGVDKEFSTAQLNSLKEIFDRIRYYNLNAIVRFAYDFDGNTNKEPKSFNTIEKHIGNLSSVFETYKDVIMCIEAGFIGPWGEMHDGGDYQDDSYYKKLVQSLLNNTPTSMTVNVRTPYIYKLVFNSLNNSSANRYRVGIFNDGYLGSATDLGTFDANTNRDTFVNWMNVQGKYTYYGGEVTKFNTSSESYSPEDEQWSESSYAVEEMPQTHTTYLNGSFNDLILTTKWKNQTYSNSDSEYNGQTAYKYIVDHLGYRLVLRDSQISETVKQGDVCGVKLKIENVGFGNIIRKQDVSVILSDGSKYYEAKLNIDARDFNSGTSSDESFYFYVPSDIAIGDWNVYLKIASVDNSNYAIKFANADIWNSNLDANLIGKVTIEENSEATPTNIKQSFENDSTDGIETTVTEKDEIELESSVIFKCEYFLSGAKPSQLVESKEVYVQLGTTIDFTNKSSIEALGLDIPSGYSFKFVQCPDLKGDWGGYNKLDIPNETDAISYYAQVHLTRDGYSRLNFYYYDVSGTSSELKETRTIFVPYGASINLTDEDVLKSLGLTLPEGYKYSHAESYDIYKAWTHYDVIDVPSTPEKDEYGIQIHMLPK